MREPKIPPMKIKVEHTLRVKGFGRTFLAASTAYAAIKIVDKAIADLPFFRKNVVVDFAEKVGDKIGDETLRDKVEDVFNQAEKKKDGPNQGPPTSPFVNGVDE